MCVCVVYVCVCVCVCLYINGVGQRIVNLGSEFLVVREDTGIDVELVNNGGEGVSKSTQSIDGLQSERERDRERDRESVCMCERLRKRFLVP